MEGMAFTNIFNLLAAPDYSIKEVMTEWDRITTQDTKGNTFDFVPQLDKSKQVISMLVRTENGVRTVASDPSWYVSANSHLLVVIARMNDVFTNKVEGTNLTFLIVTENGENVGFLNHNDFNKLPFALLLWEISYIFEGTVGKYLREKVPPLAIEKELDDKQRKAYQEDKAENKDLHPIYYTTLGIKLRLYNKIEGREEEKLAISTELKTHMVWMRNRIAHPSEKPKIIRKKNDVNDLFKGLALLNHWITLPNVKTWRKN